MDSPIIMGRKTFESIGKPLPGRTNIVVSKTLKNDNIFIVKSLQDAFQIAEKNLGYGHWCFVIGGSILYKEALNYVDELILTKINGAFQCDTFFPEIKNWKLNEILVETPLQDKNTNKFYNVKIEIFKRK